MAELLGISLTEFCEADRRILQLVEFEAQTNQQILEALETWEIQEMLFSMSWDLMMFCHGDKISCNNHNDAECWHQLKSRTTAKLESLQCGHLTDLTHDGVTRLQCWLAQRYRSFF